jgi:hypothetical protein
MRTMHDQEVESQAPHQPCLLPDMAVAISSGWRERVEQIGARSFLLGSCLEFAHTLVDNLKLFPIFFFTLH